MRRYYSLNEYLRNKYGQKVYKLALDCGFTCPNRDGTLSSEGCSFCAEGGSGHFAKPDLEAAKAFLHNRPAKIEFRETQLSNMQYDSTTRGGLPLPSLENTPSYGEGWERKDKNVGNKYIAYYQTYSNTYAPVDMLREIYEPALDDEEIVGLAIATRPDCLPDDVLDLLEEISRIKPLWVELGLQTIHEETAKRFGRGYPLSVFDDAVQKLRERGIDVVVHLIVGLPGETFEDVLESVCYINNCDVQGIKLHMLTIIKGTRLGDLYEEALAASQKAVSLNGPLTLENKLTFSDGSDYPFITLDAYADLICDCIGNLRPEIIVHRITGDAPKDRLLSPMWTADKKRVLNIINQRLEQRNIKQGCLID